jgi:tripartite-type tricarboxylate transporter receptor subunit TctC
VQDLLGGNLSFAMASVLVAKAQVEKGAMRAYAVNGDERLALMPTVPTFKELGYTDPVLNMRPWFAAYAPAGTPKPVVEKINALLRSALQAPDVAKNLSEKGFIPIASSTAEHQRELSVQIQIFTKVMRDIGIQAD